MLVTKSENHLRMNLHYKLYCYEFSDSQQSCSEIFHYVQQKHKHIPVPRYSNFHLNSRHCALYDGT